MANIKHTPRTWGISVEDFEKLGWGSALGKFKVPNSVIKRFRKTVINVSGDEVTIFDFESAFYELGTTYINAIVASYAILRETSFYMFEEDTRQSLIYVIYNAIEFALLNKQVWENVNASSVTTPNFTITQDQVAWMLSRDMIGMKAENYLTASGLEDYEWIDGGTMYKETQNNNLKVIGSMDEIYQEALQDPSDGKIWLGTEHDIDDLKDYYGL